MAGATPEQAPGAGPARPPWSVFRAELERIGFHPSRGLGQNFLLDENLVRAIVQDAGVAPGELVLEVGTGCGFLTLHLAELGVELVTVEVDRRLAGVAEKLLGRRPNVRAIRADVLASKHRLEPEVEAALPGPGPPARPWHLVANLPYAIASPLLVVLARRANPPQSATVLVQLEVAERLTAEPGTAAWGPLGLRLAVTHRARLVRKVPAALFWPRPRVESAVVRLVLLPERPAADELARLDRLVDLLFQRRRKSLRAVLAGELGGAGAATELLARLGLDPLRRAETLPLATLAALAEALREHLERP